MEVIHCPATRLNTNLTCEVATQETVLPHRLLQSVPGWGIRPACLSPSCPRELGSTCRLSFPRESPGPPELQPLCPTLPWNECWLNTFQVSKWGLADFGWSASPSLSCWADRGVPPFLLGMALTLTK